MALGWMFTYLEKHGNLRLVFDPTRPNSRDKYSLDVYWSEFYQGEKEVIPENEPYTRGNSFNINLFLYSIHTKNMVTSWSYYGFLIFIGKPPSIWYLNNQNKIESAEFGAEFVALQEEKQVNKPLQ